jgi:subtilisin family serine protease
MRSHQRHPTMIALATAAALCISCTDRDPTTAAGRARTDELAGAAASFEGCTSLEVRLSGRDGATVRADTSGACGPVVPMVVGVPVFDRARGTLRLPVALRNGGTQKVRAPARLYAWEDSATVIDPPGLARNRHAAGYLQLAGADSAIAADAAEHAGAQVWTYDGSLAAADSAQTLAGGQTSRVRWVELRVHEGVHAFRLVLHASARRASPPVPAVAPDTVPQAIFDSANVVADPPEFTGRILRNIVVVEFREDASQTERQQAVDLVDGEVVGGWQFGVGEGWYAVRVPDDGSTVRLFRAIHLLAGLPQVVLAGPHVVDAPVPGYLQPHDGPAFTGYSLQAAQASNLKWGLEVVGAPMAWGCSTGDPGLPIAIADAGFDTPPDLLPNVDTRASWGIAAAGDTLTHGTQVASVVAAAGNNGIQMTGVLWNADLRLYDVYIDSVGGAFRPAQGYPAELQRFTLAARRGARIINFSFYDDWRGHVPSEAVPGDTARRNWMARTSRQRVAAMERAGLRPLIVVIAGNNALSVEWNGIARMKEAAPDRVLVVGAAQRGAAYPFVELAGAFSNTGSLVDLAAPGRRVGTLTRQDTLAAASGTSFAAPFVTGVAGLIMSFDSTLRDRPAEVKRLIVAGAARGGIPIANGNGPGVYLLNGYESLKLAAQRRGAPVCGNRVWTSADRIVLQRDTASGAVADTLYPSFLPSAVDVMHGGRRIRVRDLAGGERDFTYENGQWERGAWNHAAAFDVFVPGSGAAYLSAGDVFNFKAPRTHDGDTTFTLQSNGDPSNVTLSRFTGGTLTSLGTFDASDRPQRQPACIWAPYDPASPTEPHNCTVGTDSFPDYERGDWNLGVLPAPNDSVVLGAKLLMVNRRQRISTTFGAWSTDACPRLPREGGLDSLVMVCRGWTTRIASAGTRYTALDADGAPLRTWTDGGGEVDLRALSEDGRRAMVKRWVQTSVFETRIVAPYSARGRQTGYVGACTVEDLRLRDGQVLWTGPSCRDSGVDPGLSPARMPAVRLIAATGVAARARPAQGALPWPIATPLLFFWT